jgi:hypothetical protein
MIIRAVANSSRFVTALIFAETRYIENWTEYNNNIYIKEAMIYGN